MRKALILGLLLLTSCSMKSASYSHDPFKLAALEAESTESPDDYPVRVTMYLNNGQVAHQVTLMKSRMQASPEQHWVAVASHPKMLWSGDFSIEMVER